MMFSVMVNSKKDLKYILLENAQLYNIVEESTGKQANISVKVLNDIIRDIVV